MVEAIWREGTVGYWFVSTNWEFDTPPIEGDTALIGSGTAIIDAPSHPLLGIAIILGEDDPVLRAIDVTFEGLATNVGGHPSEVNATLTVTGYNPADPNDASFVIQGVTSFDGQIFVEAINGSLTILIEEDNQSQVGVFRLLSQDNKAAVLVGQESVLDFEGAAGSSVYNAAFIQIEGTAEISDNVSVTGVTPSGNGAVGGVFMLENGGKLVVEGAIDNTQAIAFVDGTGQLVIENIADFDAVIEFAELPPAAGQQGQAIAGGRIYLTDVAAQSFAYQAGMGTNPGTLQLFSGSQQNGAVVAELDMRLVGSNLIWSRTALTDDDFLLSSDGEGGTVITFNPGGSHYQYQSLPTPVIASPGQVVKLANILKASFGKSDVPFEGIWLFPPEAFENTPTNVGYWGTPNVTPQWYIGGKAVEGPTYVTDISKVTLHVGNQINNPATFQIRTTEATTGPDAAFVTYNVWTVDPRVIDAMKLAGVSPGTLPTAEVVVKTAEAFAQVYGDGVIPNTNLCNWIADNVAAAAGAPMPTINTSLDPSLNQEGGFWRIVYRSSDMTDPPQNWSGFVEPGDIIRMGWFKPETGRLSGHSTTALSSVGLSGEITFYDNVDSGHIGIHEQAYWHATDPDDITIFRIDSTQYLIEGTDVAETIRGSVYNNLIRPGGGADTIDAKFGNNEIEGTAAELNGIKATYFDFGDWFHFKDLDASDTTVSFKSGKLLVFDGGDKVAAINVPKPADGLSFYVAPDEEEGGVVIQLGSGSIVVAGYLNGDDNLHAAPRTISDGDKTPSNADGTDFGKVSVGDTVIHTFTIYNTGQAPMTISKVVLPKGYVLVDAPPSTIAGGESATLQIQLDTTKAGVKSGMLEIETDVPGDPVFDFKLSGTVTEESSAGKFDDILHDFMKEADNGLLQFVLSVVHDTYFGRHSKESQGHDQGFDDWLV
jgi:hypothetical protein